jgi:cation diffusion facilitator family transporter
MRKPYDKGAVVMNRLEKAAVVSAGATAAIALIKFLAGTLFGSIALVADAIHSFTDIVGSIAVFFGVRFSEVKSKRFPYGLYKLENLVSLFLALLIFYTGLEILDEALAAVLGNVSQQAGPIAIAAALFSLVVSFLLASYKFRVGREENSPSMLSEANHTQLDAITTVGVLFGVSASFAGFPFLDPVVGIGIALLVFKAGAEILFDSAKVLLDISLDYKTMKRIERIAESQKNVQVKELAARNSGRYVFVDLKLETNLKDLKKVDQLRKECEEKIRKAVPRIDKLMIDVEYKKKDVLVYAVPLEGNSFKSAVAREFGTAKFFGLARVSNKAGNKKLLESRVIENPYWKSKSRKGILAAEFLAKNSVDVLFSKDEMHKGGAYYALQENFVEIEKTGKKDFEKVLEGLK